MQGPTAAQGPQGTRHNYRPQARGLDCPQTSEQIPNLFFIRNAELFLKLNLYLFMKLLICQALANQSGFKEEFQIEHFPIFIGKFFIGPSKLKIIHVQTFDPCLSLLFLQSS